MEDKANIIVIEGPQGVGKSTMANFLRDNLESTNLYRLTGIKDKTIRGKDKNYNMYLKLIDYMKNLEEYELNLVFDRTFFSEQVYSLLGYKPYNWSNCYEEVLKKFAKLDYNIYLVFLYLEDTNLYEKRLQREHHTYQAFSKQNSIDQQNTYLKLLDNINYKEINIIKIATDDYDNAYNKLIEKIPILKKQKLNINERIDQNNR